METTPTLPRLNPADAGGTRPIERAAVYCWHGECRGVQLTGPDGRVRFDTLYPAPEADGTALPTPASTPR